MQFQMMVERYRDASSFADTYAKSRFKSVCQNMTAQTSNWKPTLPAAIQSIQVQKTSDASVDYLCATIPAQAGQRLRAHQPLFPNRFLASRPSAQRRHYAGAHARRAIGIATCARYLPN